MEENFMFLMNLLTTICLEIRKFIHFKKSKAIDEEKMTLDVTDGNLHKNQIQLNRQILEPRKIVSSFYWLYITIPSVVRYVIAFLIVLKKCRLLKTCEYIAY